MGLEGVVRKIDTNITRLQSEVGMKPIKEDGLNCNLHKGDLDEMRQTKGVGLGHVEDENNGTFVDVGEGCWSFREGQLVSRGTIEF